VLDAAWALLDRSRARFVPASRGVRRALRGLEVRQVQNEIQADGTGLVLRYAAIDVGSVRPVVVREAGFRAEKVGTPNGVSKRAQA
jgi:hypothetical protein